jgi:hypothetical protein
MTTQRPIEDVLNEEGSLGDVIATLEALRIDLKERPDSWENPSLERYLEAMQAWLSAFSGRLGDKPSWKLISEMLEAAKIYE